MARYSKQTWTDGSSQATAARLGVLETGIFAVDYRPAVRVFHNAAQSATNNVNLVLAFNSERFDQEANAASTMHDTVTNNSRLIAKTAGIYLVGGHIEWAANATGVRDLFIRHSAGPTAYGYTRDSTVTAVTIEQSVTTCVSMAVNDYVELIAFQNSGGALNVNASAAISPEFWMVLVG